MQNGNHSKKKSVLVIGFLIVGASFAGAWRTWLENREMEGEVRANIEETKSLDGGTSEPSQEAMSAESSPETAEPRKSDEEPSNLSPEEVKGMICSTEGAGKNSSDPYYSECREAGY